MYFGELRIEFNNYWDLPQGKGVSLGNERFQLQDCPLRLLLKKKRKNFTTLVERELIKLCENTGTTNLFSQTMFDIRVSSNK